MFELPVKLGINIGYENLNMRDITDPAKRVTGLEIGELVQLGGADYPFDGDGKIAYLYEYVDPNPNSSIVNIEYVPINKGAKVNFIHTDFEQNPESLADKAKELPSFATTREFTSEEWGRDWDMFGDE